MLPFIGAGTRTGLVRAEVQDPLQLPVAGESVVVFRNICQ